MVNSSASDINLNSDDPINTSSTIVNVASTKTQIININPTAQLPIKLIGGANFATWKAQIQKEAWDYLHTTYANRSQTRIYSLRDALAKVQRDKKSVTDYLREIRTITDELAAAGARISNEALVVKILSGLGPEYEALSTVIHSRDSPISYEELAHKLMNHELYLKQTDKKQPPTPITAQVAQRKNNHNNNSNRQTRRWSDHTISFPITLRSPLPIEDPNLVVFPSDSTAPAIVVRPPSELPAIRRNQVTSSPLDNSFFTAESSTTPPSNSLPQQQHLPQLNLPSQTNQSLPPRRPVTRSQHQITKPNPKYASMATLTSQIPPVTVKQACKDPQWRQAMQSEFDALMSNQTWNFIPPSDHQNIVENKWIFRIKRKPDGSIERYKARLVAKGFNQWPGIDYVDTFSPVVKPTIIRTVLDIATQNKWPLHQLDINNAFLQGTLTEEVFMKQPKGFENPDYPNYVCKLNKAIYGIDVLPQSAGLFLSQTKYIMDILQEFSMQDCQGVSTPLSTTISLRLNDGSPPTDAKQYRSAIGKLQYLAFTRPDISFAVNKLSVDTQFRPSPIIINF
ncbi:hypothetical protein MTR67_051095 [Solanum verrucosum]|uniref:Reverse transcriptase Ty1/copia-type domain-containing protein n=1 Tax=Solanum verrucosum TaxID=315347 RepID=A0AAF1A242_SOLVR|nr:hypothetical protein MTR67_051095 [Solanum verrucosum]